MYISIFLDVEDCITPLSDDIVKDLAGILSDHGLVGDLMVVGDKARALERRGRWDVIEALRRHKVGLHSDRHSRHPTVAEYLEDKRWDDGIQEAVRREGPGADTLRRLFGSSPACWGVPGGSWGPQIHPAMKRLGVQAIVYTETYTASSDVHWYAGALTFSYRHFFEGLDASYSDDARFQKRFHALQRRIAEYLDAGFPWMGLFAAHPITVRAYEFGDAINFGRGKDPPPESWREPQLKSEAEYRTALKNFAVLVKYIATHPHLQVAPIGTLVEEFGRVADRINQDELHSYACAVRNLKDIATDDTRLSPAEAIDVLVQAILAFTNKVEPSEFVIRHVDGPVTPPPEDRPEIHVPWETFQSMCEFVKLFIDQTGHLPAAIEVAGTKVGIGSFYHAICDSFVALAALQEPSNVTLPSGPQIPSIADTIAEKTENGYHNWVIHKPDLNVTNLLELTRLQTWTLKPASH